MKSITTRIEAAPRSRHSFSDLTGALEDAVQHSDIVTGCVIAFSTHTTCTLVINENESGAFDDLDLRLRELIPHDSYYAHDDMTRRTQNLDAEDERENGQAHVTQMILGGSSQVIPIEDGRPVLGRWQRLLLLELDGPRKRTVVLHLLGETDAAG